MIGCILNVDNSRENIADLPSSRRSTRMDLAASDQPGNIIWVVQATRRLRQRGCPLQRVCCGGYQRIHEQASRPARTALFFGDVTETKLSSSSTPAMRLLSSSAAISRRWLAAACSGREKISFWAISCVGRMRATQLFKLYRQLLALGDFQPGMTSSNHPI